MAALHERAELVVIELRFGEPRSLFEHDDAEASRGKLFGDDAAGGAGPDNDEIDCIGRPKAHALLSLRHDYRGSFPELELASAS